MKKPPKRRPGKKKSHVAMALRPSGVPAGARSQGQDCGAKPAPARREPEMLAADVQRQLQPAKPVVLSPPTLISRCKLWLTQNKAPIGDGARFAVPFAVMAVLMLAQAVWQRPHLLWDQGTRDIAADLPFAEAKPVDRWIALATSPHTQALGTRHARLPDAIIKAPAPIGGGAMIDAVRLAVARPAQQRAADAGGVLAAAAGPQQQLAALAPVSEPRAVFAAAVRPSNSIANVHWSDTQDRLAMNAIAVAHYAAAAEPALMATALPRNVRTRLISVAPADPGICTLDQSPAQRVARTVMPVLQGYKFGIALADAAVAQTADLVIYDETYRSIRYPGGDVAALHGVCTDVVIRAYRALGVDLQVLVHQSGARKGDANIDHRRTEILRRFFERAGAGLPVTPFGDDYRPGDIVTYHRPQNNGVPWHIAIVSGAIGPSGRPMIVHNRGAGVELEDALFVDTITGHFRFDGARAAAWAAEMAAVRRQQPLRAQAISKRPRIASRALRSTIGLQAKAAETGLSSRRPF